MTLKVPYQAPDIVRKLAVAINDLIDGKSNNIGTVTLATGTTTTTVTDRRVGVGSVVTMMPLDANAAAEAWHISTTASQFTITHANAGTTRQFRYVVTG